MATADRVTRTAVHVIADTDTEPESSVNVTRTAVHAIADTDTEPPSPVNVTRTAVHSLIDTGAEPPSLVQVTRTAVHVLFLSINPLGSIDFNARLRFRVTGCFTYNTKFRFRIRNAEDTDDILVVDSDRSSGDGFIVEAPRVDGQTFDPLTGKTTVGQANILVLDPNADPCLAPDDPVRLVTSILADSAGNSQLLSRRAYIEITRDGLASPWEPYFAGYITSLSLVDGVTWEISLAHTTRDDETTKVWATSDYPNLYATSRMVGGPVSDPVPSGFGGVPVSDFQGYWQATVKGKYNTFVHLDIDEDDCGGFPPTDIAPFLEDNQWWFSFSNNDFQRNVFKWAQGNAQKYFLRGFPCTAAQTEWTTNPTGKAEIRGYMPRLWAHFVEQNGSPIDVAVPMMASYSKGDKDTLCWEDLGNHFYVYWPNSSNLSDPSVTTTVANNTLSVNDELKFYIRAVDTSEAAPVWLLGHPVDVLKEALEATGATVNDVTEAKAGMGDFQIGMRVTKPFTVSEAIAALCGAFGLGVRYDDDGTRTIFCWRTRRVPVATITLDDLTEPASSWWKTEEQSKVFSLEWKLKRFDQWPGQDQQGSPGDRAFDGVQEFDEQPITFQLGTTQPSGTRTESYEIPAALLTSTGDKVLSMVDVCAVWSDQTFGVYANGAVTTEIEVFHELLDGDMPQVGDEVMLDLSPRPGIDIAESPTSQRGLPEHCLVIGRDPLPTGYKLTLLAVPVDIAPPSDPGANIPSPSLLDTAFTAAKGAGSFSTNTVVLTLVNDIGWEGNTLDVQYLMNPSSAPTASTNGTVFIDGWSPPAPLNLAPLPSGFPPGATVWVRVRQTGFTAWTAWQSVTLDPAQSIASAGTVQTPTLQLTVDNSGDVDVTALAGAEAVKVYAAASDTAFPSEATILAGSTDTSPPFTFNNILNVDAGETVYVGVIAEDTFGNTSIPTFAQLTRSPAVEESISVTFAGGISPSDFRDVQVPYACTVLGWAIFGDTSGSIVVDIWRDTVANFPPAVGDTITGTGKPTVSSAASATGDTTGWGSTALVKDDILRFNVDSVTSFTQVTVSLTVRRT